MLCQCLRQVSVMKSLVIFRQQSGLSPRQRSCLSYRYPAFRAEAHSAPGDSDAKRIGNQRAFNCQLKPSPASTCGSLMMGSTGETASSPGHWAKGGTTLDLTS